MISKTFELFCINNRLWWLVRALCEMSDAFLRRWSGVAEIELICSACRQTFRVERSIDPLHEVLRGKYWPRRICSDSCSRMLLRRSFSLPSDAMRQQQQQSIVTSNVTAVAFCLPSLCARSLVPYNSFSKTTIYEDSEHSIEKRKRDLQFRDFEIPRN